MKGKSNKKRIQSFILAALLSMTLLGGNVVTSMAQENEEIKNEATTNISDDSNPSDLASTDSSEKSSDNDSSDDKSDNGENSSNNDNNSNKDLTSDSNENNDEDAETSASPSSEDSEADDSALITKTASDKDSPADESSTKKSTDVSEYVDISKAEERTWDFTTNGINTHVEGSTYSYENLYIDASNGGKFKSKDGSWAQLNAGTNIYFAAPANSTITIISYLNNYIFTLSDGDTDLAATVTGESNSYTYTYEYTGSSAAVLKLTINENNTYLNSLSVSLKTDTTNESDTSKDYSSKFNYPVDNSSWDFTTYDTDNATHIESSTGTYKELYIDATTGKFETRENGNTDDAIVNGSTLIVVPFNRAGTLTVTYYNNGSYFLADGSKKLSSGDTYEYTGSGYGYVTLLAEGQVFLYSISISYPKSALDDVESSKTTVWDFGGNASGIDDATDMITVDKISNISTIGTYINSEGKEYPSSITSESSVSFGNLTLYMGKGDRFYTKESVEGKTYEATNKKGIYTFEDGYTSYGYYYANGKTSVKNGSPQSRYITISDVEEGDTFTIYMGVKFGSTSTSTSETAHFRSENGEQDETFELTGSAPGIYTFTATQSDTYTIYAENTNGGKPDFYRIVKESSSVLSGSISFEDGVSLSEDYKLIFTSTDSNDTDIVTADIDYNTNKYAVYVDNDKTYNISVSGIVGYAVTDETSSVSGSSATHDITIRKADTVNVNGTVSGIEDNYIDKYNSKITFTDSNKNVSSVNLKSDGSFEGAILEPGVTYTVTLSNCPDYEISDNTISVTSDTTEADFEASLINTYNVSGKFIGIKESDNLGTLTFINTKDKASYEATILADNAGYEISLRDGTYKVETSTSKYATSTTVTVKGEDTERDLYFAKEKSDISVGDATDIYVGYTDGRDYNFETVQEAIDAIAATRADTNQRVTVNINAGTYREQIIIDTPNVTLKADGDVTLTWYYGIGYTYYSAADGYYSEEAAYNKTSKGIVSKWGASTYIKSGATGFKADGITFENSFNLYVTDEEIEDGVTPDASAYGYSINTNVERTKATDVTSKEATERATALAIEATDAEFNNVTIRGSQDTLYTGSGTKGYFINSHISGNTDYIFGYGDWLFENCELQFEGYSDGSNKHAYITAARGEGATLGYLFDNCTITAPDEGKTIGASYLGRPWDSKAMVTFKNTTVSDDVTIYDAGWYSMSGVQPYNVNYKEYNTMVSGIAVTQETRTVDGNKNSTVYETEEALNLGVSNYIALLGWTPAALAKDASNAASDSSSDASSDSSSDASSSSSTDASSSSSSDASSDSSSDASSSSSSDASSSSNSEATTDSTSSKQTPTTNTTTATTTTTTTSEESTSSQSSNSGTASGSQDSSDTTSSDTDTTVTTVAGTQTTDESEVLGASRTDNPNVETSGNTVDSTRLASTGDNSSIASHLVIIMLACCMVIFIIEMQAREDKKA